MKGKHFLMIALCMLLLATMAACNSDRMEGKEYFMQDEAGMLSSMRTNKSSDEYPHTKALMEQPTRYIFYDVEVTDQHPDGLPFELPFEFPFLNQIDWGSEWPNDGARPQQPEQPKQPGQPTQQPEQPAEQPQQPNPAQPAAGISTTEMRVIELTNAERRKAGLPDLKADQQLTAVAREKSNDMQRNRYFSHTSPTYGSPFDMMRDMGVSYRAAGENIAMGQQTPEQVVQAWMNSEGHRQNILNRSYTHIGVGYVQDGHYWTQMFITK